MPIRYQPRRNTLHRRNAAKIAVGRARRRKKSPKRRKSTRPLGRKCGRSKEASTVHPGEIRAEGSCHDEQLIRARGGFPASKERHVTPHPVARTRGGEGKNDNPANNPNEE